MNSKKKTKRALWISNISSFLGTTFVACCAGPGIVGCAATCAPACGSLGLSIFGLSLSGLTHWLGRYWYIFLIIAILFFSEAFYRIFYVNKGYDQKVTKIIFFLSLVTSIFMFGFKLF